jgi:hypothetical protein
MYLICNAKRDGHCANGIGSPNTPCLISSNQLLKFRYLSPSGLWHPSRNMAPHEGVPTVEFVSVSPQLSPLSKTNYAFSRPQLNKLAKMLNDCDIEKFIKMPKIVFIGNQSAGKSSLIEAISKIKVPRAAGTCTRCPMEVMLCTNTAIPWQAKVSLRLSHEDGRLSAASTIPFDETNDKAEITIILRRAQLAVLNPTRPFDEFRRLTDQECQDNIPLLRFSKSTVVLEIIGADVDVTFIDLPGIISNSDDVRLFTTGFANCVGRPRHRSNQRSHSILCVSRGMFDSRHNYDERY